LANEATEIAVTIEIMAQTMRSSSSEKPVCGDLVVELGFGVEFDIFF
jgi:hypothetical protein